jgi:hypothetical protein
VSDSTSLAEREHTPARIASFAARAWGFRLARGLRDALSPTPRLAARANGDWPPEVARSSSPLYSADGESPRERGWQLGKVENLRRAVRRIHGVVLPVGATFSFWRQVGPPWRLRGFVIGRELREGCLIPSVGGGLCQLSNALYDCALKSGAEILERHRHTRVIPGSLAELNRDATVFWNYVDLRFRATRPLRISARLTRDQLVVTFHALSSGEARVLGEEARLTDPAENCATCGVESCLRHAGSGAAMQEHAAVLIDEFWPEFDDWLRAQDRSRWHLGVPMRHSLWRRPNYAWTDRGWAGVQDAPFAALSRAWRSRRLAAQGAERQRALLAFDKELAAAYARRLRATPTRDAYARRLPRQCTRAVIAQTLLPHLGEWLGGRSHTVFLTRWPIRLLQHRLDEAARVHPGSATLADFRVDATLADAEWELLERAEALVTCHARLAEIWPHKTTLLPWKWPPITKRSPRPRMNRPLVVLPASGVARKGAFELRAALRDLQLPLRIVGARQLENDTNFWKDVEIVPSPAPLEPWHAGASVVVLPAWIEHRPRRLLEAIRAGIPVVATDACGLHGWPEKASVRIVPAGDTSALRAAITESVAISTPESSAYFE